MKMDLKVSIIIPIFNAEAYLKKCLDSVIYQSYNDLEFILVNDGSTDSSKDIIDEYASKDKRIVAIHKNNGGIGSAYKIAFDVMSGDYILFVDSDDWLELNAVESLVKLSLENNADMVSFALRAYNPQGEELDLPGFKNLDLIKTTNETVLQTHFEVLKHPTLVRLFKRELFKEIVVFEQNIGIDEMLTPQLLAKCNRAIYTKKAYYNVLRRNNSVSRVNYSQKKIEEGINCYRFICSFTDNNFNKYSPIIYVKYLNFLMQVHTVASRNIELKGNKVLKILIVDFKEYLNKLKGTNKFRDLPAVIKIKMEAFANYRVLFNLIVLMQLVRRRVLKTLQVLVCLK